MKTDHKNARFLKLDHLFCEKIREDETADFSLTQSHQKTQSYKICRNLILELENITSTKEELAKHLRGDINVLFSTFTQSIYGAKLQSDFNEHENILFETIAQLNQTIAQYDFIHNPKTEIKAISLNEYFDQNFTHNPAFSNRTARGDLPIIYDDPQKLAQFFHNLSTYVRLYAAPDAQINLDFQTNRAGNFFKLTIADEETTQKKSTSPMRDAAHYPSSILYVLKAELNALGGRLWTENTPAKTHINFKIQAEAHN